MHFDYSEEQTMLKDMVDRLVADRYGFEARQAIVASDAGYSAELWSQFADLGLLGVPLSESAGGFDGGGAELMVVAEGFGRGLVVEPYLASVVLAGCFLDAALAEDDKPAWLAPIIGGEKRYALACHEPGGRYDPFWIETTAVATDGGYRLDGHKAVVIGGGQADQLIVIARTAGTPGEAEGLSAFAVAVDAPGVTRQTYPTIDGHRAADVRLDGVRVTASDVLGVLNTAGEPLVFALERGVVALCAEATGVMEVVCDLTLQYLKDRKQFGVPIGSFQALQHRMVDMRMNLEKVRSLTLWAACSLDAPADERQTRIAAAKAMVGKAGRAVAEEAIQLFGGMGMMDEAAISHYAKRLIMIDHYLGDHAYHMATLRSLTIDSAT